MKSYTYMTEKKLQRKNAKNREVFTEDLAADQLVLKL